MTPKEAAEILKIMQTQAEWDYPMDYATAIDGAIKALERQIRKDVKRNPYKECYYCPNCKGNLKDYELTKHISTF